MSTREIPQSLMISSNNTNDGRMNQTTIQIFISFALSPLYISNVGFGLYDITLHVHGVHKKEMDVCDNETQMFIQNSNLCM
jgi:hypothetical protein